MPEIIGTWIYDFCNAGESELVNLQLSLEIKQVNPFRVLETDPEEHTIPGISRGQEPLRRVGNMEVKERDHFRKEGRVHVSDAAEGSGQGG